MAEQETQLISKIVTDNTQTPVGEGGREGEVKMGRRHATGMGNALSKFAAFNYSSMVTTDHHTPQSGE